MFIEDQRFSMLVGLTYLIIETNHWCFVCFHSPPYYVLILQTGNWWFLPDHHVCDIAEGNLRLNNLFPSYTCCAVFSVVVLWINHTEYCKKVKVTGTLLPHLQLLSAIASSVPIEMTLSPDSFPGPYVHDKMNSSGLWG